jgi:hypothetical protein
MRGLGLAAIIAALVWVSAALAVSERTKPRVRLLDAQPFTLQGAHFRARERVRVTVSSANTVTKTVRTSRHGVFLMTLPDFAISRCDGLAVSAVGRSGDRASLKVLQQQDCAPSLGP